MTTMSRGTIIKFDGYIKVPEEFDYTQTIDRFKPLLVASIVNDSMDKPEQSIEGLGDFDIKVGANTFNVVVTAQDKTFLTYKLKC